MYIGTCDLYFVFRHLNMYICDIHHVHWSKTNMCILITAYTHIYTPGKQVQLIEKEAHLPNHLRSYISSLEGHHVDYSKCHDVE